MTLVLGIASNAAWAGVRALLARRPNKHLAVTYVDLERDDVKARAWRVDGETDDVLAAIDRLRCDGDT